VAYRGLDFCGWEDQRHELYRGNDNRKDDKSAKGGGDESGADNNSHILPSVQGTLVDILDLVLGKNESIGPATATHAIPPYNVKETISQSTQKEMKQNTKQRSKPNSKPIEIKVAGRTDAGVSAIAQICRIRTWRALDDVENYVKDLVNEEATNSRGGGLRIRNVECVGDDFHPTFGASCRAYAYLVDLEEEEEDANDDYCGEDEEYRQSRRPSISSHLVPKLDLMLRTLEGKELDYIALSYGKVKSQTTLCTLHRGRAEIVEWAGNDGNSTPTEKKRAICIELVGDRFLRRMVRILVSTALREANRDDAGCHDALLNILSTKDRTCRAKAAPPDGLIFVEAAY